RIGLDGIERIARKCVEKTPRRGGEFFWKDAIERLARLHHGDGFFNRAEARNGIDARGCVHAVMARRYCPVCLGQRGLGVKKYRGRAARATSCYGMELHAAKESHGSENRARTGIGAAAG